MTKNQLVGLSRYLGLVALVGLAATVAFAACSGSSDGGVAADGSNITVPPDGGSESETSPTPTSDTSGSSSSSDPPETRVDSDSDGLNDRIDLCPQEPGEVDGCPDADNDGMPDTSGSTTEPVTPDPRRVEINANWYGQAAADVVSQLDELGVVAVPYEVCGDDIEAGEVQQIMTDEGEVLLDAGGTTAAAEELTSDSVVEVRVGSGVPCE